MGVVAILYANLEGQLRGPFTSLARCRSHEADHALLTRCRCNRVAHHTKTYEEQAPTSQIVLHLLLSSQELLVSPSNTSITEARYSNLQQVQSTPAAPPAHRVIHHAANGIQATKIQNPCPRGRIYRSFSAPLYHSHTCTA